MGWSEMTGETKRAGWAGLRDEFFRVMMLPQLGAERKRAQSISWTPGPSTALRASSSSAHCRRIVLDCTNHSTIFRQCTARRHGVLCLAPLKDEARVSREMFSRESAMIHSKSATSSRKFTEESAVQGRYQSVIFQEQRVPLKRWKS